MTLECESLERCGFFKKYQDTDELACKGFINMYCRGPQRPECKRMEYRLQHGTPPSDDMLPSGAMIAQKIEGQKPFLTTHNR
jgi:hypothetical protein